MGVTVTFHEDEIARLLTGPDGAVVQAVEDVCRQVANEARRRCPVDEGRLRASIQYTVQVQGGLVVGRVGSDLEYAGYVHEGTGLYGPKHALIFPVSASVMTWVPRTGGQGSKTVRGRKTARDTTRVFARYTRGMKGRPFLVEALEAVSPWPVDVIRGL